MQLYKHDQADIDYLHSEQICGVIANGLTEIYRKRPRYPIDYLAKWLLSNSRTQLAQEAFEAQQFEKENLHIKHIQDLLHEKQILQEELRHKNERNQIITNFEERIKNHEYHLELMQQELCDFLLEQKQLSGVYACHLDIQKQSVDINVNDSDTAHINKNASKLLHYVAASKNHRFLIGRTLQPEQGLTYDVLKPPENGTVQPIYVPDVIKEHRIYFHQWPKLGAYLAVPLIYKSYLFEEAFDTGLENRLQYLEKKNQQNAAFESKRLEFENNMKHKLEAQEDTQELEEEFQAYKDSLEEIIEQASPSVKEEYILCFDTLGQDQGISQENREYLKGFVEYFGRCWEDRERNALSQSIDHQLQYLQDLPNTVEEQLQQIQTAEDTYVEERMSENLEYYTELQQNDERVHTYELDCMRLHNLREHLRRDEFQQTLLNLARRRVIKFPGILQSALYLIGYHKNDINIENTNVLNWRKLQGMLNAELLSKILSYEHKGQNPNKPHPWGMIDRIAKQIQNYDQESVDNYCLAYGLLLKFLFLACRLRREDIELRRLALEKLREQIVQANQQIIHMKNQLDMDLEAKKAELSEEELQTFDEEEWRNQYNNDNPLPEVPEDREDEVDEDYQFD